MPEETSRAGQESATKSPWPGQDRHRACGWGGRRRHRVRGAEGSLRPQVPALRQVLAALRLARQEEAGGLDLGASRCHPGYAPLRAGCPEHGAGAEAVLCSVKLF